MTYWEKLDLIRDNWTKLKTNGQLEVSILDAIGKHTIEMEGLSVQDIIDIEESIPEYLI